MRLVHSVGIVINIWTFTSRAWDRTVLVSVYVRRHYSLSLCIRVCYLLRFLHLRRVKFRVWFLRQGPRNMQGFKQTVKRLEEISVSSRGIERVQLLRRWLVALKEVDRFLPGSIEGGKSSPTDQLNDENKDSPKKPTLVCISISVGSISWKFLHVSFDWRICGCFLFVFSPSIERHEMLLDILRRSIMWTQIWEAS